MMIGLNSLAMIPVICDELLGDFQKSDIREEALDALRGVTESICSAIVKELLFTRTGKCFARRSAPQDPKLCDERTPPFTVIEGLIQFHWRFSQATRLS